VAIKVVRKEFADDPEFRRRFRQEVSAAQRVQGIYTAPVLDADPHAPIPWLATAYIAGPSLAQAVAEHGPFPAVSVYRLMAGVAEGLGSVHAAGLVHRDLKPANVLLAEDGPRVIDFGIAHAIDASALTSTGALIGTPAFMAPEQVSGRPVSPATDVFALAHLVAYAATGHTVFGDGHFTALVYRIANEDPSLEGCPETMRPLLARCLAKNPADRPDLAEVVEFARQALSGQTFNLVGASWLPDPVASNLLAYDSAAIPPLAVPRSSAARSPAPGPSVPGASVPRVPPPGAHPSFPSVPGVVPADAATATAGYLQGPGAPHGPGYTPNYSGGATGPEALEPRKRLLLRPGFLVPAAVALVILIGGGAYLGLSGDGTPDAAPTIGVGAKAPATASVGSQPSPVGRTSPSVTPSTSATSAGDASNSTYSSSEPFPLCDSDGGQWKLINLIPGSCGQNMEPEADDVGYSFATLPSIPHGVPLTASNTVTLTGEIPGDAFNDTWCLGSAEGGATSGYIGLICNDGNWYIDSVTGLGTSSPVVGRQVDTGSFPFDGSTSYDISLAFRSGTGKLTITFTQGSASPLTQSFPTGQFTPVAVGYVLNGTGNDESGAQIGGFTYEDG
jgi:serine/threonine protein kinase